MNQINQEEWRAIPGYEGRYEVSSLGGVRSVARRVEFGRGFRQIESAPIYQHQACRRNTPYMQVTLWIGNKCKSFKVHTLVLLAFVGPKPPSMQCRHKDGDSLRNHAGNLVWGTSEQNIADRSLHGRHNIKGTANPRSRLCSSDVLAIRASAASQRDLADLYSVSTTTIRHIKKGSTWTHLSGN